MPCVPSDPIRKRPTTLPVPLPDSGAQLPDSGDHLSTAPADVDTHHSIRGTTERMVPPKEREARHGKAISAALCRSSVATLYSPRRATLSECAAPASYSPRQRHSCRRRADTADPKLPQRMSTNARKQCRDFAMFDTATKGMSAIVAVWVESEDIWSVKSQRHV